MAAWTASGCSTGKSAPAEPTPIVGFTSPAAVVLPKSDGLSGWALLSLTCLKPDEAAAAGHGLTEDCRALFRNAAGPTRALTATVSVFDSEDNAKAFFDTMTTQEVQRTFPQHLTAVSTDVSAFAAFVERLPNGKFWAVRTGKPPGGGTEGYYVVDREGVGVFRLILETELGGLGSQTDYLDIASAMDARLADLPGSP